MGTGAWRRSPFAYPEHKDRRWTTSLWRVDAQTTRAGNPMYSIHHISVRCFGRRKESLVVQRNHQRKFKVFSVIFESQYGELTSYFFRCQLLKWFVVVVLSLSCPSSVIYCHVRYQTWRWLVWDSHSMDTSTSEMGMPIFEEIPCSNSCSGLWY